MEHFDSEAMEQWLAGERSAGAERHLAECSRCREEVDRLTSAISGFRDSVRQWSAAQEIPRPASWEARRAWAPLKWALAAAVVLVLTGVPLYRNFEQRRAVAQARADAKLLDEVSRDISRSAPEPLEPLLQLVSQNSTGENQ